MQYPIPSYCTISRRLQGLPFAPGVQLDILDLMSAKLKTLPSHAQMVVLKVWLFFFSNQLKEGSYLYFSLLIYCIMLQMDEMSMAPGLQYDPATKTVLGSVTLPPTADKHAKKLLTCMLSCLTSHYKQVVAYHFTGSSVSGSDLWELVQNIVMACGERGIRVVAVVRSQVSCNCFKVIQIHWSRWVYRLLFL